MKYKYIPVAKGVEIPVRVGLTPEQEAEILARFIAENDPDAYLRRLLADMTPEEVEAECREALTAYERGETFTLAEVLAELEEELRPGHEGAA